MKKLLLIAALSILPISAMAQDVTLTVNPAELQLVGRGLGKLLYDEAAPLISKLQGQVTAQQQPKVEPQKPVDNDKPK